MHKHFRMVILFYGSLLESRPLRGLGWWNSLGKGKLWASLSSPDLLSEVKSDCKEMYLVFIKWNNLSVHVVHPDIFCKLKFALWKIYCLITKRGVANQSVRIRVHVERSIFALRHWFLYDDILHIWTRINIRVDGKVHVR